MKERAGYVTEKIRDNAFAYVDLTKQQAKVLKVIQKWGPISNEGIADHLNCPVHYVTPRTGELRTLGEIEVCGEGVSPRSGRPVALWRLTTNKQFNLF